MDGSVIAAGMPAHCIEKPARMRLWEKCCRFV
jgi:hypothetical protein